MAAARVIDSDAHVDETEATWEFVGPDAAQFKPTAGQADRDGGRRYWLINGRKEGRPTRDDRISKTTVETRELLDVPARLRHMDELGIDMQVIYPSMFLQVPTVQPEAELAISRAYNRWLAERTAESGGRLRWVCVPPLRNMDEALAELRFAKDHGACGVLKKSDYEVDYVPYDPYFWPLYEEAERLSLPICLHAGSGVFRPDGGPELNRCFGLSFVGVMVGIYSVMANGIPARFPKLRIGAIEAGAAWLPAVSHWLQRGVGKPHLFQTGQQRNLQGEVPREISFAANRVYVTCHVDDDLPMLLNYISEDNLLVGSDYGHTDMNEELGFSSGLRELADQGRIPQTMPAKILRDNARVFYDL